MPSRRSCSTLRRVAALFHISGFIAGASRIGRLPPGDRAGEIVGMARAIFAIRSAVAGATTIRSHSRGLADVTGVEFAAGVEQIGIDALMRQRAGGKRRDELLRGLGQHTADVECAAPSAAGSVPAI